MTVEIEGRVIRVDRSGGDRLTASRRCASFMSTIARWPLRGRSVVSHALNALGLPEGSLRSLLHTDTRNDY